MSDPVAVLQDELRSIALDHALEPADRHARLRALRERLTELTGEADRRISDGQKVREARASGAAREVLWARGNADIREELLRLGEASEADLDEAGLLSHDELDRLQEEGLLEEALFGLARKFDELLHRRDRTGKWVDMPDAPTPPDKIPPTPAAPLEKPTPRRPFKLRPKLATPEDSERDEVQLRALADYLAVKAEAAEVGITPALQEAIDALEGAHLEGLEHRLKSRASIVSKIKRKRDKMPLATDQERADSITDLVRYTAVVPTDNYNKGVEDVLGALEAQGFVQTEFENYWGGGDDYDALHVGLESPEGVTVELQFHTPESLDVKTAKNHPIYERFRESKDAHERWQMWEEMVENTKTIPRPRGVEELGPVKAKPAPVSPKPTDYLDYTLDAERVPIDKIKPTRLRQEALPEARRRMDAAQAGEGPRRAPLDVRELPDGTFELLDGNTTYAVLKERGAKDVIVRRAARVEKVSPEAIAAMRDPLAHPGPDEGLAFDYAEGLLKSGLEKLEAGATFEELTDEEQNVVGLAAGRAKNWANSKATGRVLAAAREMNAIAEKKRKKAEKAGSG